MKVTKSGFPNHDMYVKVLVFSDPYFKKNYILFVTLILLHLFYQN